MAEDQPITIASTLLMTSDGYSTETADKLEPGMQFGRYVIKALLGEGGMGVVYAAFDPTLHRRIAIKVLCVSNVSGAIDTQSARSRMLREAQAMAMCGHPNLVQVFDVGTYNDDVFIAMEFVDGTTLRDWLEERPDADWKTILKKFLHAARGLSAAHDRHLIHRDFKPENVMVDVNGHVRVMDFGLARHTGGDPDTTAETPAALIRPLTQTGMIMGTPAYMAPEQFLADYTDARTDQFSFCVALFEALYGYRPFKGDSMKHLAKSVMRGEITLPPKKTPVPDHILTALLKGLQTESDDRHDSMTLLIDALTFKPAADSQGDPRILYGTALFVALSGVILYWFTAQRMIDSPYPMVQKRPPQEIAARVEPTIPSVKDGVITENQMAFVVAKYQDDIEDCVAQGRKRDQIVAGTVGLDFRIVTSDEDPTKGQVERVALNDRDIFNKRTARCILGLSMSWEFPAPACQGGIKCHAEVTSRIEIKAPAKLPGIEKPKKE